MFTIIKPVVLKPPKCRDCKWNKKGANKFSSDECTRFRYTITNTESIFYINDFSDLCRRPDGQCGPGAIYFEKNE